MVTIHFLNRGSGIDSTIKGVQVLTEFQERPAAGLNLTKYNHITDHMAPICVCMGIPLLLSDDDHFDLACKYYPDLDARQLQYSEQTPQYFMENYDVLFRSEIWKMDVLWKKLAPLEENLGKRLRCVHCLHGFSDKAFWIKETVHEDITLIYGQNMLDMLRECTVLDKMRSTVMTGNYRWTYYQVHKEKLDQLVDEEVFSQFAKKQRCILYAPSWSDQEGPCSFYSAITQIVDKLPDCYNLLVKLHPRMGRNDPAQFYQLLGQHEHKDNVVFLESYPLVYPILARSDIYIGDRSSVGYDFLRFDRPMFFLNEGQWNAKTDREAFIYRCGTVLQLEEYSNIFGCIEAALKKDAQFAPIRQKTYLYTFGEDRSFDEVKKAIVAAYNEPPQD